jgi:cell division inhibitor SepF
MSDKIFDKVKYFMGLDAEDDAGESEGIEEIIPQESTPYARESYRKTETLQKSTRESKVIQMNNTSEKVNVTILKPEDFNDSATVVNNLKAQKPVIVNLEAVEQETARKIFDFCSGALYALNGKIYKVSRNIFLMAPENVDISGNLKNSVDSEFDME